MKPIIKIPSKWNGIFGDTSPLKRLLIFSCILAAAFRILGQSQPQPTFEQYTDDDGLSNGFVTCLYQDKLGFMWFGTANGFNRLDGSPFKSWTTVDGQANSLSHPNVWAIHGAKDGMVWVGTEKGLSRFTRRSKNYTAHYQHIPRDKRSLSDNRITKGSSGDTNHWPSPLRLHISYTRAIELPYWQNDFVLEFATSDDAVLLNNRYKYKLEGYDQAWIETDAGRPFVRYTDLQPGYYTFKVVPSNSDGRFNTQMFKLPIRIYAPWWYRWWAWLIWLSLGFGIIYLGWRNELQRRLAQAEALRLQQMDAFKSHFFTNMTHEFRTPLTVILGLAEVLEEKVEPDIQPSLEAIRRNGLQLLEQVNEMLDLSKAESGKLALQAIQGDIVHYLRYLVESFQSLAASKSIQLEYKADLPELHMDFDPWRLQQIVSNLLSNAIKFTPTGGAIDLMAHKEKDKLWVIVKDNGIGIPEDKLTQVFERFFQVDASNTRRGEGTGIGLSLSRELALLMQGDIQVFRRPEGGTEFKVMLPITTQGEKPGEVNPVPKYKPKEQTYATQTELADSSAPLLLIVEDNVDVVQYLRSCFMNNYRIEWASDGQQGIEKAIELVPDLILSDVMMPIKDGYELCHTLKTDARSSHIPIILLTAKADIASKLDGLQQGADVYLVKPFHAGELLTQVHNLLANRKKLQHYYLHQSGLSLASTSTPTTLPQFEQVMEHAFIQKVKTLLEADLSKKWEVPELARALQVSVSQLHRKLEALTGMHTTAFVRQVRLMKASEKLRSAPGEKIAHIGYEVGFSSPNEFTRRFKEVFGVTPGEWRSQHSS